MYGVRHHVLRTILYDYARFYRTFASMLIWTEKEVVQLHVLLVYAFPHYDHLPYTPMALALEPTLDTMKLPKIRWPLFIEILSSYSKGRSEGYAQTISLPPCRSHSSSNNDPSFLCSSLCTEGISSFGADTSRLAIPRPAVLDFTKGNRVCEVTEPKGHLVRCLGDIVHSYGQCL